MQKLKDQITPHVKPSDCYGTDDLGYLGMVGADRWMDR